jgi:formate-dependent phosphoribosylglycinamide formyltransferase (GAR transformylase)
LKRVLLLAATTGYQTRSFGEAAEKLGVRLVFATDRCDQIEDPWWDQAIPIRFHDEERSVQAIVDAVNGNAPAGILTVGDRPTLVAARAAQALGLPGNPPDAACASRNKLASRRALAAAGLPTPWFRPVLSDLDPRQMAADISYPCVVKPLALSGSRGVIRANDAEEFVAAFNRLRTLLQATDVRVERDAAHDAIMIESFVPGREFALEGLLTGGSLRTLALFDKPDPLDGPFFEETIYVTPSTAPLAQQQRIEEAIAAAARALGLRHGPVHAECRVNDEGVFVLEVAARPIGGLCSRALRFILAGRKDPPYRDGQGPPYGDDGEAGVIALEELLLRHAIGEDVSSYGREPRASGVMMIPIPRRGIYRGVDALDEARAVEGIDDVQITAKADQLLVPLPEGKSYLGFIFARADRPREVEAALREAHARLRFRVDRALI